jgi:hypothetical protein
MAAGFVVGGTHCKGKMAANREAFPATGVWDRDHAIGRPVQPENSDKDHFACGPRLSRIDGGVAYARAPRIFRR